MLERMITTKPTGLVRAVVRNRALGAAAVLSLALSAAGCAAPEPANVILSTSTSGYSVVVGTGTGDGSSAAAQLKGSLVLGPGGCLEVLDDTGTSTWLVLPAGSTVVEGEVPSLSIGGKVYNVGDQVDFGGGFFPLNEASVKVAGACALKSEPFTVHSTGS